MAAGRQANRPYARRGRRAKSTSMTEPPEVLNIDSADKEPPTVKGRKTRDAIIHAAENLFRSRSYREVTVADITTAAGVSIGTFYRYFPSREDLFVFLLSRVFGEMYESTRGSWQPSSLLLPNFERATARYLRAYSSNRTILRSAYELSGSSEQVAQLWRALRDSLYERMLVRLRQDQELSKLQRLDPLTTMRALGSMIDEYARRAFAYDEYGPAAGSDFDGAATVLAAIWHRSIFGEEAPREYSDAAEKQPVAERVADQSEWN